MHRRLVWCAALLALAGCGGGGHSRAAAVPKVRLVPFDAGGAHRAGWRSGLPRAALPGVAARGGGQGPHPRPRHAGGRHGHARAAQPRPAGLPADGTAGRALHRRHSAAAAAPAPVAGELARVPAGGPGGVRAARAGSRPGGGGAARLGQLVPARGVAAKQKGDRRRRQALRLTLPAHGGSLHAGYTAVVSCDRATAPSTIGMRPFAPEPLTAAARVHGSSADRDRASADRREGCPACPARARSCASRSACAIARPPRPCASTVAARCWRRSSRRSGRRRPHRLNCAAAKPIAPGRAQWFEMRVQVPPNAPLGPNGLFWRLDPTGDFGPQVVARVVVRP